MCQIVLDNLPLWWYIYNMRVKTSVSLSNELLSEISHYSAEGERSEFVEKAVWNYIQYLNKHIRNQNDFQKINYASDFLNSEASDVLSYQVPL